MNQYLLLTLATLPSVYIGYSLLEADKKDRNNTIVYQLFFIGLALALPIVFLENYLIENVLQASPFTFAFLVASLIEEGIKLLVLLGVISIIKEKVDNGDYTLKKLDTYHYILLSVAISLGIATAENIVYVINNGVTNAIFRAIFAVPMHASCGYLMGYIYSSKDTTTTTTFDAFIVPFLVHGFYNFCLLSTEIPSLIAFVFIAGVIWGVIQLHKVVVAFHFSSKEKVKFSWQENLIKPGLGEIHTLNSFNDKIWTLLIYLLFVCIGITIFFYTPIADFIFNIIEEVLKFILSFFE